MAKRKKVLEVQKFGGTEDLGIVKEEGNKQNFHSYLSNKEFQKEDVSWDTHSIETQSTTTLETDQGDGRAVVIRNYKFKIDAEVLTKFYLTTTQYPNKQDLFNSVVKFIELSLWRDGLQVFPDTEPRVLISDSYTEFEVFVGATPKRGEMLLEAPKTLSQLVNG